MQATEERQQRFGLHGRFAARERHAATFSEERLQRFSLFHDIVGACQFALSDGFNRVGVGAIEAAEGAALQKDHIPQSRAVESAG